MVLGEGMTVFAVLLILLTVAQAEQGKSKPTLTETLSWLKSRIDYQDAEAAVAIPTRREFSYSGCSVTFAHYGFQITDVALDGLSAVRLEEKSDLRWADLYLVFEAAPGRSFRDRGDIVGKAGNRTQFRWTVGAKSKPVYDLDGRASVKELGDRMLKAFSHAAQLCGAKLREEPF